MSAATTTAPQERPSVPGEIARRIVRLGGPLAGPLAGRRFIPIWALMHHTGRVSGRPFATPIAIVRTPTGFMVPLPFGGAQWPRNVIAAGGATMRWKGRDWAVTEPVILGPEGSPAFNRFERLAMRPFGVSRFLRLTVAKTPTKA